MALAITGVVLISMGIVQKLGDRFVQGVFRRTGYLSDTRMKRYPTYSRYVSIVLVATGIGLLVLAIVAGF